MASEQYQKGRPDVHLRPTPEIGMYFRNWDESGWSEIFKEISTLVDGAERQYGIANLNYLDYVMDRLELSISTCFNLLEATLTLQNWINVLAL